MGPTSPWRNATAPTAGDAPPLSEPASSGAGFFTPTASSLAKSADRATAAASGAS